MFVEGGYCTSYVYPEVIMKRRRCREKWVVAMKTKKNSLPNPGEIVKKEPRENEDIHDDAEVGEVLNKIGQQESDN